MTAKAHRDNLRLVLGLPTAGAIRREWKDTMKAGIVAIGSELLLGQVVETNSAWMAQRLAGQGINLFYKPPSQKRPTGISPTTRVQVVFSTASSRLC